jgi:hypothetical protein
VIFGTETSVDASDDQSEYYEYPWTIESVLCSGQAMVRSLFQSPDITYIFSKSMPRSGHRFLSECLMHYFGRKLHYCGFYRPDCCHRIPCARPHNSDASNRYFLQKSHDFGFRDAADLNGRFLIQFRSPIPRLQSNYDLSIARGVGEEGKEAFVTFAEKETTYFINFYRKWIAARRYNTLAIAYEDLIDAQEQTLTAASGFIQGDAAIDGDALAAMLARAGWRQRRPGRLARPAAASLLRCRPLCQARAPGGRRLQPKPYPVSFHLRR